MLCTELFGHVKGRKRVKARDDLSYSPERATELVHSKRMMHERLRSSANEGEKGRRQKKYGFQKL